MQLVAEISQKIEFGRFKEIGQLVENALTQGISAEDILNHGLLDGMEKIGEKFKNNKVYIPEVMMAARAMQIGIDTLKPYFKEKGGAGRGRACIGTVKGDQHDIGKNLVKIMLEGRGIEVVDLGTNVPPEAFVAAAKNQNCSLICCSALLTTTMYEMKNVVDLCVAEGIRDKVKIMVGGAPLSEDFCQKIGADAYAPDAASAAEQALALLSQLRES